jgi:predicted metal-dependent hydrolase
VPDYNYSLIRSKRKTVAIYILPGGIVQVRAPLRCPKSDIDRFVNQKAAWIERRVQKSRDIAEQKELNRTQISPQERDELIARLKAEAKVILPQRVAYYADKMGITVGKIRISSAKTRWGSCSSKGNLNFSWRLMLADEAARDYVVVHELAHRLQMNHSERFWAIVAGIIPDWRARKQRLRVLERQMAAEGMFD